MAWAAVALAACIALMITTIPPVYVFEHKNIDLVDAIPQHESAKAEESKEPQERKILDAVSPAVKKQVTPSAPLVAAAPAPAPPTPPPIEAPTPTANAAQISPRDKEEADSTKGDVKTAQNVEVAIAAEVLNADARQQGQQGQQGQNVQQAFANAPTAQSFASPAATLTPVPPPTTALRAAVGRGGASAAKALSVAESVAVDMTPFGSIQLYLNQNKFPPRDLVSIEGMIDHFTYDYPSPSGKNPIGATLEVAGAPWNPQHRLVRIGIKAKNTVKDVMVQVEFNPAVVETYQRIGDETANNNVRNAGDMVPGRTMTDLYEVVPRVQPGKDSIEMLKMTISYDGKNLSFPLVDRGQTFARASTDFRFAAAVASFGMILRGSSNKDTATLDSTLAIAEKSIGPDRNGSRQEFIRLIRRAQQVHGR
jgi:hypothetical protein